MVKVLFDHNSPPALARALHEIIKDDGHKACALRDKFETNIDDISLYKNLGREGNWIVITKDKAQAARIGKKAAERDAIMSSNVPAFFMSPKVGKMPITQQAAIILWQWERILTQSNLVDRGLFLLPENKGSKFRSL